MKKLVILLLVLTTVACRKQRAENPTIKIDQPGIDNIPVKEYDVPNWHDEMLVATLSKSDLQAGGPDSMYSYVHEGHLYLKYEGAAYRVVAYDDPKQPSDKNDAVYFIRITTLNGKRLAEGFANPSKYEQNGQMVTSKQSIHVNQGGQAPFNKVGPTVYIGK